MPNPPPFGTGYEKDCFLKAPDLFADPIPAFLQHGYETQHQGSFFGEVGDCAIDDLEGDAIGMSTAEFEEQLPPSRRLRGGPCERIHQGCVPIDESQGAGEIAGRHRSAEERHRPERSGLCQVHLRWRRGNTIGHPGGRCLIHGVGTRPAFEGARREERSYEKEGLDTHEATSDSDGPQRQLCPNQGSRRR